MRFVIARLNHETNTFSPVPTPLEAFDPKWGDNARLAAAGSSTAMGAFLEFAEARGTEIVTPVFATANPSGPVAERAFEELSGSIINAVRKGCDAILLDLHGAMVTANRDDGEGDLLARLRKVAPDIPIGVALDLHGNITEQMIENSDVIVGFKTYPHVDMKETGTHVANLVGRILDDGLRPVQARSHPPQLASTLMMNTTEHGAMRDLIDLARKAESRAGIMAVSVFGGFPLSDIPDAGVSVVVVADTPENARSVSKEIGRAAWESRSKLTYKEMPLKQSVNDARAATELPGRGPVLMLDHGDNCMSGGTCDTMDVLAEALRQGLEGIVVGPICDPQAVNAMVKAGVGSTVSVAVGNRSATPVSGWNPGPLELNGTVLNLGDGEYVIDGPTYKGMRCSMGRTAVLDIGSAKILVAERPHEPWDKGVFSSSGIDPEDCQFLILKSRMYCRPVFAPLAKTVFECASIGVTSSDYNLFRFENLKRPIYPLDEDTNWTAEAR